MDDTIRFAPQLMLKNVLAGMEFYIKAFGAVELRRWSNSDGSVHVAEMRIGEAMFHLHEESSKSAQLSPESTKGVNVVIGLFVPDPYSFVDKAATAGAKVKNPVQDYDYGYCQGTIVDPFGHQWLIEKMI